MKKIAAIFSTIILTHSYANFTINVSGKDGKHGRDGEGYSTYSQSNSWGSGDDGRNGEDATPSSPGENSNHLNITLKSISKDEFSIEAKELNSENNSVVRVHTKTLKTSGSDDLVLKAIGGDGGNGGDGGDGEGGEDGGDGDDASRYSFASNGDPAGDGGDGGDATPGSNGGDGGNITINVNHKDTHLLLKVNSYNSGGRGGSSSQNGEGGRGGDGGDGGNSWSCMSDYCGGLASRSGGYDGSDGRNGSDGSGRTHGGSAGDSGKLVINIHRPNGVIKTYSEIYKLQATSYSLIDENGDGVIEPGEKVTIKNLKLRNNADMAMPLGQPVKIDLRSDGHVGKHIGIYTLKKRIPGQGHILVKNPGMSFVVAESARVTDIANLDVTSRINLNASMPSVNKSLSHFDGDTRFEIENPIAVRALFKSTSLQVGESLPVIWEIRNKSDKSYGIDTEIARILQLNMKYIGGDLNFNYIEFKNEKGEVKDLAEVFVQEIRKLSPHTTAYIRGQLKVKEGADPFTGANFESSFNLGKFDQSGELQRIKYDSFVLRVSSSYNENSKGDLLLLVNYNTDTVQIKAWQNMAKQLDMNLDIWDISNKGYFKLSEEGKDGLVFGERLKNKTIILLDNDTDNGKISSIIDAKKQFVEAGLLYGLNIYRIEDRPSRYDIESKFRNRTKTDLIKIESIAAFTDYLENLIDQTEGKQTYRGENYTQNSYEIDVTETYVWSKDDHYDFRDLVADFEADLKKMYPERRYFVEREYMGEVLSKEGSVFKQARTGKIFVKRGMDRDDWIVTNNSGGTAAKNINTREARFGLILSMAFPQKMDLFNKFVMESDLNVETNYEIAKDIVNAIQIDLAIEQGAMRVDRAAPTTSKKHMALKMDKFKYFALNSYKVQIQVGTKRSALIADLMAGVITLAESGLRWTDYVLPFFYSSDFMVYSAMALYYSDMVEKFFAGEYVRDDYGETHSLSWLDRQFVDGKFEDELDLAKAKYKEIMQELKEKLDAKENNGDIFQFRAVFLNAEYQNLN